MTQENLITMTQKELSRYEIIKRLINGYINGTEASKQIGLTVRQTKNIKAAVKKYGLKGVIHGNRGRESNKKIDEKIITKATKYLKTMYYDFQPTHAMEKLEEEHKIKLSKEKVRQIMAKWKLWKIKSRKQPKKYRSWRPRKDNYGEMQQFDGCYHAWFGNEESCLLLSVDDATGKITHAKFDYSEGIIPVFKFWTEYFNQNNLPISIYLDKFSTYKINHKNAQDNKELITQFQRATNQVGIRLIVAHSPQAKGRVEKMFNTLQNRLVKEMRLAGISTTKEANKFLETFIPKFNEKFAVIPNKKADLHKSMNKQLKQKLFQIFSIQKKRQIQNDYTIRFENQYFQLDEKQPTTVYKKESIIVEEHLNGDTKINFKEHYLNYTVLPERPKKVIDIKLAAITTQKQFNYIPPVDHPWRKFIINPKKIHQTSSEPKKTHSGQI